MTGEEKTPETTLETRSQPGSGNGTPEPAPVPGIRVDDANVMPFYANFCRVTGTPEEVVFDFGINTQPFSSGAPVVRVQQRVVMNFYTAKRMLRALELTIQRHEATFGPLETDVQKRVVASASAKSDAA